MSVAENLTVETPVPQAPAPVLDTPNPAPVVETPAPTADKKPSLREGFESSLKAIRDRPRDEVGRFAQSPAKPADPAAVAKPAAPAPAQPAAVVAPVRPADMPKAWKAEAGQHWSTLPPEARAYITERETQMEAFHAKHAGLGQWQEAAAANGTTLNEVLERVSVVESALADNPANGLIQACQMVGLDRDGAVQALQGALQALGVTAPAPGVQPQPQPNGQVPPPVADPRVDQLQRQLQTMTQSMQQQELAKADQAVKAFAADPANKHWNDVAEDVVRELKAMRAIGQQPDLKTAYDRAVRLHPTISAQLHAEEVAKKVAEAQAASAQALDKSRSASRSVAGAPPVAEGRSLADKPSKLRDMIAQGVQGALGSRA